MEHSQRKISIVRTLGVLIMYFLTNAPGFSGSSEPSETKEIKIFSTVPTTPVFVGMERNPLLRIAVHLPADKQVSYKTIQSKLNDTALDDIEKLEVFFTQSEPMFVPDQLIATVKPASTTFDIPIDVDLDAGLHYFWISITLKESANIDHKIEMRCTGLVDSENDTCKIAEEEADYVKRIGVAIRKARDEGVDTFRIPGIATTDKGTLIAVYDVRYENSRDLPGNIDVGMSRSMDGGRTWEPTGQGMDGTPQLLSRTT